MQITDTILMIRPAAFGFNEETAANNYFQNKPEETAASLQQTALQQFDGMVAVLQDHGINVIVAEDTADPPKPDAIFPNNWFCAGNNTITVFPMYAQSRRKEKKG